MALATIPSYGDASEDDEEEAAAGGGGGGWVEMAWRLGKRVAIAGAAFIAAPIVVPSYCAASTVGLALSVPFGLYLATMAATEKVMSSLLPPASLAEPDEDEGEERFIVDVEEEGEEGETPVAEQEVMAPQSKRTSTTELSLEAQTEPLTLEEDKEEEGGYVEPSMVVKTSPYERLERKDMIWEEISALRTIMGYRAPLRSSTVEELRALYIFTGVEPPISLKDPSNMMEIQDKLQFLKLLVGVK
ncbi:hypothetical protein MUK42_04739 [Musa troglodytarum]|uniref:Uncharacterized protein n=1 Tax=Musa troglodytarum TaxID=320322 RepID=A0A9E7L481_9LILI|nr:hypothetical protein MUK42_04739 [Musa troglodytarum]